MTSSSSSDSDSYSDVLDATSSDSDGGAPRQRVDRPRLPGISTPRVKPPTRDEVRRAQVRQSELLAWSARADFAEAVRGALIRIRPSSVGQIVAVEEPADTRKRHQPVLNVEIFRDRSLDSVVIKSSEVLEDALSPEDYRVLVEHQRCPGSRELQEVAVRVEATRRSEETSENFSEKRLKSAMTSTSRLLLQAVLDEHQELLHRLERTPNPDAQVEAAIVKQRERVAQLERRYNTVTARDSQETAVYVETNEEKAQKMLARLKRRTSGEEKLSVKKSDGEDQKLSSAAAIGDAIGDAFGSSGLGFLFGDASKSGDEDGDDESDGTSI
jgi:hypothetical protein